MRERLSPAEAHHGLWLQLEQLASAMALTPAQTRHLARTAHFRTYAAGEVILQAQSRPDCLGLIVQGRVATHPSRTIDRVPSRFLEPGQTFGQTMLAQGQPCSATYQAVTPCTIWFICRSDLSGQPAGRTGAPAAGRLLPRWAGRAVVLLLALLAGLTALGLPLTRQVTALAPMSLGQWCSEKGYDRCAEWAWSEAAALTPSDANPLIALGTLDAARGDYGAAERSFESARHLLPDSPEIHNNLGVLHALRKDYVQAVSAFRQALELDPGASAIHQNLGFSLLMLGDLDGALAHYQSARAMGEPQASALVNMAIAYYETGQPFRALDAGRQAMFVDGESASAYTVLGASAIELGCPAEAVPFLEQAVTLEGMDGQALFYLGVAYKAAGQRTKARETFQQAMSAARDDELRRSILQQSGDRE